MRITKEEEEEGLTVLIVESNEWSNLESTEGIAERQRERRALLIHTVEL